MKSLKKRDNFDDYKYDLSKQITIMKLQIKCCKTECLTFNFVYDNITINLKKEIV